MKACYFSLKIAFIQMCCWISAVHALTLVQSYFVVGNQIFMTIWDFAVHESSGIIYAIYIDTETSWLYLYTVKPQGVPTSAKLFRDSESVSLSMFLDSDSIVLSTRGNSIKQYLLDYNSSSTIKWSGTLFCGSEVVSTVFYGNYQEFLGVTSFGNMCRFTWPNQVVWKTSIKMAPGELYSSPWLSDEQTLIMVTEQSFGVSRWHGFNFTTGKSVAIPSLNCTTSYNLADYRSDPDIIVCRSRQKGFYLQAFSDTGNRTWKSTDSFISATFMQDSTIVASINDKSWFHSITILSFDLQVMDRAVFPEGIWIQQMYVTDKSVYLWVTSNRLTINNTRIADGINILQLDFPRKIIKSTVSTTTSMLPSKTPTGKWENQNNSNPLFLIYAISIAPATLIIVLAGYLILRHNRKSLVPTKDSDIHTSMTSQSITSSSSISYVTEARTLFNTKIPLSVPGYLEVKPSDFRFLSKLTSGGAGSIFIVELLNPNLQKTINDNKCIAKVPLTPEKSLRNERKVLQFLQEVALMHHLNNSSEYFAKIIGYEPTTLSMLMKFYPVGSLYSLIRKRQYGWTKRFFMPLLSDIAHGLHAMHNLGFAHCDLKPENVLIDFNNYRNRESAVLTDLGISRVINDQSLGVNSFEAQSFLGLSFCHAAPELIRQFRARGADTRSSEVVLSADIYAFSIMIRECITKDVKTWSVSSQRSHSKTTSTVGSKKRLNA